MTELDDQPRRVCITIAALGLALALPACGDNVGIDTGQGETAGDGDPGDGDGDGDPGDGDPGDGDGDPYTGECTISVVDHSQSCPDCPIVNDLRVHCDDYAFGAPGLRVAPAPDSDNIYLVTSSDAYAWFGDLAPDAGGELDALPEPFARKVIGLAQDPSGAPFLAADQTTISSGNYPGGVVLYDPIGGDEQLVYDNPDKYSPLIDTEFDSLGRAHLWVITDAPDERTEFIREPGVDGTWSSAPAPVPGTSGWQRYGLTSDAVSVAFDFAESPPGSYRMLADEGEGAYPASSSFGPNYPGAYAFAVPPALPSLDAPGPRYLVFSQHESSFRVAAPGPDTYDELMLLGAGAIDFSCLDDYDNQPGSCPVSCDELADGLFEGQVSVARTSDGRVWAAHLLTHVDQTLVYEESCDEEVGCWCNWDVTRDDSWGELILSRVDVTNDEVVEVMRVDTLDGELDDAFGDYRESSRTFDMRAFGQALAIGMRVRSVEGGAQAPDIRVLRVDTGGLL